MGFVDFVFSVIGEYRCKNFVSPNVYRIEFTIIYSAGFTVDTPIY